MYAAAARWDAANQRWIQLLDWMGFNDSEDKSTSSIAIDTTAGDDVARQNTIYAALGGYTYGTATKPEGNGLYRSFDRGDTWTRIWGGVVNLRMGWLTQASFSGNSSGHVYGEQLALDPLNPDVLYVGTANAGLHRTFDARAAEPTFSKIDGAPVGFVDHDYFPQGIRVVFVDPRQGTVEAGTPRERSRVVYLGLRSNADPAFTGGVHRSEDGGETFRDLLHRSEPRRLRRRLPEAFLHRERLRQRCHRLARVDRDRLHLQ